MEKNFSAEPIVVLNRRILAQLAMPNYTITEISREDLPKLRDLYNRSDPSTILGYGVIENYLRWFQLNPDYNDAKFYCLNENWTDGTFIALDKHALYFNTLNKDLTNLKELIRLSPRHEFTLAAAVYGPHIPIVEEVLISKNFQVVFRCECYLFHLPKESALKFEINVPVGMVLKPLNLSHVTQIHQDYPYKDYHPEFLFENLIRYNLSIGLFIELTDELIGWCLRYPNGMISQLQVEENYRRMGYAEVLVKAMAKKIAEVGDDSCAGIYRGTVSSQKLFQKCWFVHTGIETTWINFVPKSEGVSLELKEY